MVPYTIHLVHELRPKVLGSLASVLLDTELICHSVVVRGAQHYV